jgi:hypothetical protein
MFGLLEAADCAFNAMKNQKGIFFRLDCKSKWKIVNDVGKINSLKQH